MFAPRYPLWFAMALFALLATVASAGDSHWKLYKSRHGKIYANPSEDIARKSIFLKNKRAIEEHNSGFGAGASYLRELNKFSDRTEDELDIKFGHTNVVLSNEQHAKMALDKLDQNSHRLLERLLSDDDAGGSVPDEVDWRIVPGRVSPVSDQGNCNSGWAFATVGVLEGQQANLNRSNLVQLSAQNLLDCSGSNAGCSGGAVAFALADVKDEQGINDEQVYPYTGKQSECKFNRAKSVMVNSDWKYLDQNETFIERVVAKFGPVAAQIDVRAKLRDYKSGIYAKDAHCAPDPYYACHGLLIVGYGKDKQVGDYWIIKNSWGAEWGEHGHFRMVMHHNLCGIASKVTIPIF